MKKHLIALSVVLLLMITGCQMGDTTPSDTQNPNDAAVESGCSHNWSEWSVDTAATCTASGLQSRTCGICSDTETQYIPQLDHVGTVTESVSAREPDCSTEGSVNIVCVCGTVIRTETVPALGHTLTADPAVAATCTTTGLSEGSHCSVCGVITEAQTEIAVLDHTVSVTPAVASTCSSTGLTEGKHCTMCGEILEKQEIVAKRSHTAVVDPAVAATCSSTGLTEGSHCSVCGEVLTKQKTVSKLNHTVVVDPAVAATCSSTGLTEGSHCSVCGKVLTKQNTISKLSHTAVVDKGVAATCEATGLTTGKHCTVCSKVLTEQKVIPAKEHDMVKKVVPTNGYDPGYTVHFCLWCSHSYTEEDKNFNLSDYSIDKLKFILNDTFQAKLYKAFEKCMDIYDKNNINDAGKLTNALHEMKILWDDIKRQNDIASLFSYYDVSDKKLQSNYTYAYKASSEAYDTAWYLFGKSYRTKSVLSEIAQTFYYSNYKIVDGPSYDVSAYRKRMDAIEQEFLQFNTKGTAEEVYEMYTEYLDLSHKLAQGYGYDNYYEYASERIYRRDYGKKEREAFREFVRDYIVPLCKRLKSESQAFDRTISRADYDLSIDYEQNRYDSFGENYLYSYLSSLPGNAGSIMKNAFDSHRILIGDQPNSYNTAFVTTIGTIPYCYFHYDSMDLTTVAHELGHYYASTVVDPDISRSQDIYEVQSEGNVMLMFRYLSEEIDSPAFDSFVAYALYEMAYQAIYSAIRDEFSEIMFSDPDAPNFTIEEIGAVMEGLLEKYNATDISDRFTELQMSYWHRLGLRHPVYDISYAVSFVVVYQIYRNSEHNYEAAATQYRKLVNEMDKTSTFIKTVENAGLFSPFVKEAYADFLS